MIKSLETPSEGRRGWFRRRQRARSRTQLGAQDRSLFTRFVEVTARFMGTSKFILWMTVFVVVWIMASPALSTWMDTHNPWDSCPFILLNLTFPTQVSCTALLIMFVQNRQDDRNRVIAKQDRQRTARTLADTEYLTRETAALHLAISELTTRDSVRSELHGLLAGLESREVIPPANDSGADV